MTMMLSRAAKGRPRPSTLQYIRSEATRQLKGSTGGPPIRVAVAHFSTLQSCNSTRWKVPFRRPIDNNTSHVHVALVSAAPAASSSPLFQHQVRWKRKGGASAFSEPRPPTRKQRKAYYRRKRKLYQEKHGKHSAPGAKAGYRRQWEKETFQELLDWNKKDDDLEQERLEYDYGDALVDDLMGNTSTYTSLPTPRPVYLGHRHKKYYNRVKKTMEMYRQERDKLIQPHDGTNISTEGEISSSSGGSRAVSHQQLKPPSDHDISLVLRAYRDRNGTKTRPIGIVKALKHLLTDLSLSTAMFGEGTYTTLLTCCRTPAEARRIFRLAKEQQHPISSYSWAILVDIHAKLADFEGCDAVLKEMVTEGALPSLPAYTSLMAACYKVCNNGTIPHAIRDRAAKLGWNRWKEMIIMGIEPDAMAYGSLLRLIGARGQPEKAINILEEMQTKGVKPTTLCFTSALKAVSRSQQTAVRFERGASKKNRRRQQITAHHGKLARKIVILAENAEVEQDDGFVAALMMCAGAAGDSATAKAILLASEVRKMDQLRTIGPDEHLKQLRGEQQQSGWTTSPDAISVGPNDSVALNNVGSGSSALVSRTNGGSIAKSSKPKKRHPSFEEREYGNDTRKLTALLFACSQAVDREGLGMQWAGRYSKGYLCENSLRLLTTRPQPKYFNADIPGVSSKEVGMGSISWEDEEPEHLSKSLRRAKYRGIKQDDSVGHTMEDIDDDFFKMFRDDYKEKMDNDPVIDPMLLTKAEWDALKEAKAADALREKMKQKTNDTSSSIQEATYRESDEEWYFDDDARRWVTRKRQMVESSTSVSDQSSDDVPEADEPVKADRKPKSSGEDDEDETEMYFDNEQRRWMTRPKTVSEHKSGMTETASSSVPEGVVNTAANAAVDDELEAFISELKEQIKESGDEIEFDKEEVRELFALTRGLDEDGSQEGSDDETDSKGMTNYDEQQEFETFFDEIKDEWGISESDARAMYDSIDITDGKRAPSVTSSPSTEQTETTFGVATSKPVLDLERQTGEYGNVIERTRTTSTPVERGAETTLELWDDEIDAKLAAIQEVLPGLPQSRVRKVLRTFEKSLSYPSMLELVPILRENMPDHLTSGWLKRRNVRNAEVVLEQAEEEDAVDVPILNGALQVKTSAGSLDEALAYHQDAFEKNGLNPTAYSDRLVLQMLVRNNRMTRALAFKQKVEEEGRHLDVMSYGSLIEYYGNHGKLGSAMMVLKECLETHGAPPGAKSLTKLRLLCRQHDLEAKLRLEELIGKDPMEWLRHGEANLKREMSYRGRRDVNLARNRAVQA